MPKSKYSFSRVFFHVPSNDTLDDNYIAFKAALRRLKGFVELDSDCDDDVENSDYYIVVMEAPEGQYIDASYAASIQKQIDFIVDKVSKA